MTQTLFGELFEPSEFNVPLVPECTNLGQEAVSRLVLLGNFPSGLFLQLWEASGDTSTFWRAV